ncbi:hypothetical protein FRB99_005423 [Tulasnella sp. 403]|nr:hypothetical protein FRB99_005423 [Tulasnella sp. 403]
MFLRTSQHVFNAACSSEHASKQPLSRSSASQSPEVRAEAKYRSAKDRTWSVDNASRGGLETPGTSALVLALHNFSLQDPSTSSTTKNNSPVSEEAKSVRQPLLPISENVVSGLSGKLEALDLQSSSALPVITITTTGTNATFENTRPQAGATRSHGNIQKPFGPPRSPSTASSSSPETTNRIMFPSPIPSFPPFTPRQSNDDDVAIYQFHSGGNDSSSEPLITPSNPAYYIVPSTCDKRRRTITGVLEIPDLQDPSRPLKKLKKANGTALAADARLSNVNLKELLMPTAIDVVDFIQRKGGRCYEGDIFSRFRTGESEHVRSVVNVIIEHFTVVSIGPDRRRWVSLKQDVAPSPIESP